MSGLERRLVQWWIDSGATYSGTYAAFNSPDVAVAGAIMNSPTVALGGAVGSIVERRCFTCHGTAASLGRRVEKGRPNVPKHSWNLYNLSRPEKSLILMAPLAGEADGYGWCKAKDGQPDAVFRDARDPDYLTILQAIEAAKARQQETKRFAMPGFRPNEHYVRWMKRYGVLPAAFDRAADAIDVYEVDRAYWRSLWYRCSRPPTGARCNSPLAF